MYVTCDNDKVCCSFSNASSNIECRNYPEKRVRIDRPMHVSVESDELHPVDHHLEA